VTAAPACPRISSIHYAIPRACKLRLVRDMPSPRGFPPPDPPEPLTAPHCRVCARDTPFAAAARRDATLPNALHDVAVPVCCAAPGGKTPRTRLGFPWPSAPDRTTADTHYNVADSSSSAKPVDSPLEPSVLGQRPPPNRDHAIRTDRRHRGAWITKAPIAGSLLGRR
jgi:hypothetical protein